MKTSELIEIANKCYHGISCDVKFNCPFYDSNECHEELAKRLADRLEKAYDAEIEKSGV